MRTKPNALNIRQERFVELVAAGSSGAQAYMDAGYKVSRTVASANAGKLLKNPLVARRLKEIRAATKTTAATNRAALVDRLWATLNTPIRQITPDSVLCQEWVEEMVAGGARGKLRKGHAPRGNEIAGPVVLRRKIKMVDKMSAARLLVDVMGWKEPEQHVIETGPNTLDEIKARASRVVSALDAWTNRAKRAAPAGEENLQKPS